MFCNYGYCLIICVVLFWDCGVVVASGWVWMGLFVWVGLFACCGGLVCWLGCLPLGVCWIVIVWFVWLVFWLCLCNGGGVVFVMWVVVFEVGWVCLLVVEGFDFTFSVGYLLLLQGVGCLVVWVVFGWCFVCVFVFVWLWVCLDWVIIDLLLFCWMRLFVAWVFCGGLDLLIWGLCLLLVSWFLWFYGYCVLLVLWVVCCL